MESFAAHASPSHSGFEENHPREEKNRLGEDVTMDLFLEELRVGLPDSAQMARIVVRLVAAAVLGAAVGIQRERAGKPAGVRTHMLVALGVALFVIASLEFGMSSSDLSRVIQGVATGIGFI